jgi:hypothetical protein
MDRVKEIRSEKRVPEKDSEYRFLFEQGTTYYNNIMVKQFAFLPVAKMQQFPKRESFFSRSSRSSSKASNFSIQEDVNDAGDLMLEIEQEFEKMFKW